MMPVGSPEDATVLLNQVPAGDSAAASRLLQWLYGELRVLARGRFNGAPDPTNPPTAVIHEAYMRLLGNGKSPQWANRRQFFAAAGRVIRQIRIDQARRRNRLKRGGEQQRTTLEDDPRAWDSDPAEVLAVHEALEALQQIDPRKVELIDLRFFAELTEEETAAALGLSRRTVQLEWRLARAWLHRFMTKGDTKA